MGRGVGVIKELRREVWVEGLEYAKVVWGIEEGLWG